MERTVKTQYGFFYDQSRCCGCQTCAVACKNWNSLLPGPLKYLKIYEYEKGSFPNVRVHFQWVPCYHCEQPACLDACPSQAIYKETKYGAVLINSEKCTGCRACYDACPYGAPVFESDESGCIAQKCNMCIDRLESGEKPICVLACPNRALDFGPINDLVTLYGDRRDLEDMPSSRITKPAIICKPHTEKQQIIPYDSEKALRLLMRRDPLPAIYSSISEVMDIPDGMIGRNKLVIKHESSSDLIRYTKNDEG